MAGKSTLLAATTRAAPKIASYPFTTVTPNLGVWQSSDAADAADGASFVIAGPTTQGTTHTVHLHSVHC